MPPPPTLIVFVRHPRPGTAKTRLIPALGTHGAPLAQHRMTHRTLAAAAVCGADVQLHVSGDPADTAALYPGPWTVHRQRDGNLGHRLASAVAGVPGPVAVIGTDCPGLTAAHLSAAFAALATHDAAIGPAVDGGYYLLALRRFTPAVFQNISWSTDRVAAQTRAAAASSGLTMAELPTLADVDEPADLAHLPPVYAPGHVVVTGATGSLGRHFIARLTAAVTAVRITAVVRAPVDLGPNVTCLVHDLTAGRLTLPDHDAVWHFAGKTDLTGHDPAAWAVNDAGTAAVVAARPKLLFHVSTAYVCGTRGGAVAETDPPPDCYRNEYEVSKAVAESRVAGVPGCVFRPSVVATDVAGSGHAIDRVATAVLGAGRSGEPLVIRLPPTASLNVVHADWVHAAMTTLAANPSGRTYHLTARRPLFLADVAAAAAAIDPSWLVVLDPSAKYRSLTPASRRLDRAITPLRHYLTADVRFDRSQFDADAADLAAMPEFDVFAVLKHRWSLACG